MSADFQADIDVVAGIEAVPTILNVVCRVTGMGFAAVARVTAARWVCLAAHDEIAFGLKPGGELEVASTLCHEIRQSREPIIIDSVREDALYCSHHTPARYGFQSYISMPIFLKDGSFFGTLCAIDPKPAHLKNDSIVGMFRLFADLISFHLDAGQRLARTEASLIDAQTASKLREQFIAVLGHDLRNPLASIAAGTQMLRQRVNEDDAAPVLDLMRNSVERISGLIDNVMDFARGRLGGGLTLERRLQSIEPVLMQVIEELRSIHPDREIDVALDLKQPIFADQGRIGQLLSNLLSNALTHGAEDAPVSVRARSSRDGFELSVANTGDPISPAAMERLFLPFSRGEVQPHRQGLGLGLYIALEIARAHGGTIDVQSSDRETRFTFSMPLGGPSQSGE